MHNSSLPFGYEKGSAEKKYINLSKLPEGEHRYRIVGRPIAGWVDWKDSKPHRFPPDKKPKQSFDPDKPMKFFWALHVWDYAREDLYVMEITQNGIKKALEEYAQSSDWGDLTTYDIKVKKEGAGKETKYTVIPIPPKPMPSFIQDELLQAPVRLEALYEGKDPWKDLEPSHELIENYEEDGMSVSQQAHLKGLLSELKDPTYQKQLEDHLQVASIFNMNVPRDYDRTIRALEKRISQREAQSA